MDNPGNRSENMLDELENNGMVWFSKKVLVYVLSGTEDFYGDFLNKSQIIQECAAAHIFMRVITKSKFIERPSKVVLFVNKIDLLESDDKQAQANRLISRCYERFEELCKCADVVIYGSGLTGYGLEKLKEEIRDA